MSETETAPQENGTVTNDLPPDIARKNKKGKYSPAKTVFASKDELKEIMDAGGEHFAHLKQYECEVAGKTYFAIANTPQVALGLVCETLGWTANNLSGRRGGFKTIATAEDYVGHLAKLSDEEREKALAALSAMLKPSGKGKGNK